MTLSRKYILKNYIQPNVEPSTCEKKSQKRMMGVFKNVIYGKV